MTTWADIQKLAADLQRVQLSESAKKLSDANCIEVISKLINSNQIDVIFTRDGHSYVTKKHLFTEVKNECLANGGRVPLTEIATSLNVDFDHVDRTVKILVQEDSEYIVNGGELFSSEYVQQLLTDLRSLMLENGARTTAFLCKHWDLSLDLLKSLLLDNLPADFDGIVDGDTLYTSEYLNHHKRYLLAVVSGITKPTSFTTIQSKVGLPAKRFWAAFDELTDAKQIFGRISGSRTSPSCTFIPSIHDKLVERYIENSFKQSEYIQTFVLKKLGYAETKEALQKLTGEKVVALSTIFLSQQLLDQSVASIKEVVEKNSICDAQTTLQNLGVPFDISDVDDICKTVVKGDKNLQADEGFVYSSALTKKVFISVQSHIEEKAHEAVTKQEAEKKQQAKAQPAAPAAKKVEDEDDWGDNKKGGKKKGGKGAAAKAPKGKQAADAGESSSSYEIDPELAETWIREADLIPQNLIPVIVEAIKPQLDDKLRDKINELMLSQKAADSASAKKNVQALQNKVSTLYDSLCIFEASCSSFSATFAPEMVSHVIKTVGNDFASAVLAYCSGHDIPANLSEKQREEILSDLPSGSKTAVTALYESLKSGEFESFHKAVEGLSARTSCGLHLRQPDNKTIASWTDNYVNELQTLISSQSDNAAILLTSVLLLLARNKKPITASGKFVVKLISELESDVPESLHSLLTSCQKGVVNCIKNKDDDVLKEMLKQDIDNLKKAVLA